MVLVDASMLSDGAQLALLEVSADPAADRRVDVVGPGGHGKTMLLTAIAAAWADAGVPVRRDVPAPGEPLDAVAALVVDDAHLLPDDRLLHLTGLAAGATGRIVVGHRPYPESRAMAALGAELARRGRPVMLGVLDRAAVAAPPQPQQGGPPHAADV
ncbi:MAG: hypothetical protein L0I24_24675, partial [Pseudonocardia sp.]|nr:hypothetical protein [Pseudonocardia sp.]